MGRNYSRKLSPTLADLPLIWDSENSDWRLSTLQSIMDLFESNMDLGRPEPNSQYTAPLTGVTVAITDNDEDTHLIITPAGTIAALTLTLPANTTVRDKQIVIVNSTQIITTLTVSANGASSVNGAPTTMAAANAYFTLKYDITVNAWYRIG